MPYSVVSSLRVPDPQNFIEVFNSKIRSSLEANGATSVSFRQIILGGEMVGTLQQSLTFNEIDDAVGALAVASTIRGRNCLRRAEPRCGFLSLTGQTCRHYGPLARQRVPRF